MAMTKGQAAVYDAFVRWSQNHPYNPSLKEIALITGLATTTVCEHATLLAEQGFLLHTHRHHRGYGVAVQGSVCPTCGTRNVGSR